VSAPGVSAGPVPFADARGCRDWLGTLPLTNVPQAQAALLQVLEAFAQAPFDGFERLKCLELMRDRIAFLQGEQRMRYVGRTLPLTAQDERAWQAGASLLVAMERLYAGVLAEALTGSGELRRLASLAAQRVVRYIGAQMSLHCSVYRRFDPALWTRLHALWRQAEAAGFAEERVKDSLEAEEGGSSVAEAYAHVVLLQAAYLSELSAPQMDFVEALLRPWARKVAVRRTVAEDTLPPVLHPLVVDLDKPIGARPLPPAEIMQRHRILDVGGLSRSIRRRVHGLRQGEDIASLQLPVQAAGVDVLSQLERLHRLWCEGMPPRPPARVPEEQRAAVLFGAPQIHFFLTGGQPFEAPDHSRELTRQEKQDIEVFGQVSSRTASLRVAEFATAKAEPWGVIDEMAGAWRLRRPDSAAQGVAIGRLIAMRLDEGAPFFLGWISALVQETDGALVATVTLFPGKPEPLPVRADSRGRAPGKWQEGFRLPALPRLHVPGSVVVPVGVARGRAIETWAEGVKTLDTTGVLERGSDFERVALAG